MMFVFALWALDGFHYPTNVLTITLNGISKVLGFACVAALFLPNPPTDVTVLQDKLKERDVSPASTS